jgi:hypothetical protein
MMEGLYLEQIENEYHFLRIYEDGELFFVTGTYTWPRPKAIADVSRWLRRGQKKNPVKGHRYRNEGGAIAFEYASDKRRFEVRGGMDAVGRVILRWRDVDLKSEWARTYSRVGEDGAVVPVIVNAANVDGLTDLPGVNKALASRIVEYRDEHGDYQTPDDLLKVKGVTEAKLAAFRERCNFAARPAVASLPTPERLVVTLDLLSKQLADTENPPSLAKAASFRRKIGRFDVYWEERSPGRFPLTIVAYARGGDAFELRGFHVDENLLEPLLEAADECSETDLKGRTGIKVMPLTAAQFNRAVIIPGHLDGYYPAPLGAVVHRVYPARDFEVPDGIDIDVYQSLTNGGGKARLDLFDWSHSPHPLLWLRVIAPPPGAGYEAMTERQLANSESVAAALERYMKEGTVELWDIKDRHVVARGSERSISIALAGTDQKEVSHQSFGAALERFLRGGDF